MPVLIGAGQVARHWRGPQDGSAPSPQSLRAQAARLALADAGVRNEVDWLAVIRTMADSVPGAPQPFGRSVNPPGALAAALGLRPRRAIYSKVGGDQPQALVNEAAEAIFAGETECVLIAGAEATAAAKRAAKLGMALDWSDPAGDLPPLEDRGLGAPLASPAELAAGMGAPVRTYPLFEHALRARLGRSPDEHRQAMSALWSSFSEVAARNPCAQFPLHRSVEFLSTPSSENYPISDPYLKWDVAQDAVNQGAALVMTSSALADRIGVPEQSCVYLTGYAEAADRLVSERSDLSRSRPIELVLRHALDAAGLFASDLEEIDLYSCFPCAVFLAAEALGISPGSRALTLTGGLPFFGGPGNSYSLHAIAEMVTRLRGRAGTTGLVLANGGYLSKEAAAIYSTDRPKQWRPVCSASLQHEIDAEPALALADPAGEALIETYTVPYAKGVPASAIVLARTPDGRRIMARSKEAASIQVLLHGDPIGRRILFAAGDPQLWTVE
jgi:acetyl-CoA C-acetyltransferase